MMLIYLQLQSVKGGDGRENGASDGSTPQGDQDQAGQTTPVWHQHQRVHSECSGTRTQLCPNKAERTVSHGRERTGTAWQGLVCVNQLAEQAEGEMLLASTKPW